MVKSKATSALTDRIKKEEKTSKYIFLYGLFMFSMIGISMHYRDGNSFFGFDIAVLAIIFALFIYVAIIRRGQNINSIITEIVEDGGRLIFQTASFNVFFFNFKSLNIQKSIDGLDISPSYYPLEKLFAVNDKVLKIAIDGRNFYILSQYFEIDINHTIKFK